MHKEIPPEVASLVDPADNGLEHVVAGSAELAVHANALTPPVQSDIVAPQAAPAIMKPNQKTESAASSADAGASGLAKAAAAKQTPISILISRKRQRLYIRKDFAPLFDSAVTIAQPDVPLGTHVFTALEFTGPEHTILRWNVVSLPGEAPKHARYVQERRDRHGRLRRREIEEEGAGYTPPPQDPAQLFDRIEIPSEVSEAIAQMIIPGSSLIISDQGLGDETGEGTDFIVVTR